MSSGITEKRSRIISGVCRASESKNLTCAVEYLPEELRDHWVTRPDSSWLLRDENLWTKEIREGSSNTRRRTNVVGSKMWQVFHGIWSMLHTDGVEIDSVHILSNRILGIYLIGTRTNTCVSCFLRQLSWASQTAHAWQPRALQLSKMVVGRRSARKLPATFVRYGEIQKFGVAVPMELCKQGCLISRRICPSRLNWRLTWSRFLSFSVFMVPNGIWAFL